MVNALLPVTDHISTDFGVDGSSRFPFKARTDTHRHNFASATADVGNQ